MIQSCTFEGDMCRRGQQSPVMDYLRRNGEECWSVQPCSEHAAFLETTMKEEKTLVHRVREGGRRLTRCHFTTLASQR